MRGETKQAAGTVPRVDGIGSPKVLWYINHYAQVPGGPGGLRHFSLARELREHGWEPYVIAASTELATGRQRRWLTMDRQVALTEHDGVRFVWLKTGDYAGNGAARVRNMLEFSWALRRRDISRVIPRPSVVIGSTVHPFAASAAEKVARDFGVPFVFEVRDLWPETLIAFGRIKRNGPAALALRSIETRLFKRAKRIVSVLPRVDNYVERIGIPRENVVWIPNGVDTRRYGDRAVDWDGGPEDGERPFTFMYLGAHGQANALDIVVRALARLERTELKDRFRFRFVGDGPLKGQLEGLARELGLQSASFEPPVPASAVPELVEMADAFVISTLNVPGLYRYGISMNKLFDYMAAARPVIAALDAVNNPILEGNCGIVVPPERADALAYAMEEVMALPRQRRREMGMAGRTYVAQNHDYGILGCRLAGVLDGLTSV